MASKQGKRSFDSLQVASENGQMMQFYLQRRFFTRFKRILVNIVHSNFQIQLGSWLCVKKRGSRALERFSSVEANTFLLQRQSLNPFISSCMSHGRGTYRFLILLPSSPRRYLNLGIFWSTVRCLLPIGASVFSESRIEASGNRCRHCSRESAEML